MFCTLSPVPSSLLTKFPEFRYGFETDEVFTVPSSIGQVCALTVLAFQQVLTYAPWWVRLMFMCMPMFNVLGVGQQTV